MGILNGILSRLGLVSKTEPAIPNSDVVMCDIHGRSGQAFVCQHLVRGSGLGFYQPDNPADDVARYSAWCGECDQVLRQEGEWNDASEEFANVTLICRGCFEVARTRNKT